MRFLRPLFDAGRPIDEIGVRFMQSVYEFLLDLTGIQLGTCRLVYRYALGLTAVVYDWFTVGVLLPWTVAIPIMFLSYLFNTWCFAIMRPSYSVAFSLLDRRQQIAGKYQAMNRLALMEQSLTNWRILYALFVLFVFAVSGIGFRLTVLGLIPGSWLLCVLVRDRDPHRFWATSSNFLPDAA